MKSFVLKLIITLSLMASIAYLSIQPVQSAPIGEESLLWDDCLDLRASIVELFLSIYTASVMQIDVSEHIADYNYGVEIFNEICTPMMLPLEEIEL